MTPGARKSREPRAPCILREVPPRPLPDGAPSDWRAYLKPRPVASLSIAAVVASFLAQRRAARSASLRDLESVCRCHIIPDLGDLEARGLAVEHVEAWLRWKSECGLAPKTRGKLLGVLGSVLEHARALGAADQVVTRLLARSSRPRAELADPERPALEVLSPAELTRLVSDPRIPYPRRLLWAALLTTGMRPGEAFALLGGDLYAARPLEELRVERAFAEKANELRATKTGRRRHVPVHPVLAELLEARGQWFARWLGRSPGPHEPLLFRPWPDRPRAPESRPAEVRPWRLQSALRWWRWDLEALGIAHPSSGPRRLYAAKHSFVSALRAGGVDRDTVSCLTHGVHRRAAGIDHYNHVSWEARCRAVLQLPFDEALMKELRELARGQMEMFR